MLYAQEFRAYPKLSLISLHFLSKLGSLPKTYTRMVTNIGNPKSGYAIKVLALQGVDVKVKPQKISFIRVNQTKIIRIITTYGLPLGFQF
ncbi:Subtilisin-like serine endopeptidase family protein [Euphorbia peplus]|nr:Subtilisin-like serine endopeptidase family protein [Euphorbia peplus]